jgi:hypothetical protein
MDDAGEGKTIRSRGTSFESLASGRSKERED